jgi:hypothetical protein
MYGWVLLLCHKASNRCRRTLVVCLFVVWLFVLCVCCVLFKYALLATGAIGHQLEMRTRTQEGTSRSNSCFATKPWVDRCCLRRRRAGSSA